MCGKIVRKRLRVRGRKMGRELNIEMDVERKKERRVRVPFTSVSVQRNGEKQTETEEKKEREITPYGRANEKIRNDKKQEV